MSVTKITERQSLIRILGRLLGILIRKNIITKEDAEYILDPNAEPSKEIQMEDSKNIFEKYLGYIPAYEVSKEDLRKQFDHFLEHPECYGYFIVRWKENDTLKNRYSFEEIIEQIEKGKEMGD